MSGLEKIIARLNEECEAQCEEIRADAAARAAELTAHAQTDGNNTIRQYEADAEKAAQRIGARAESAAAMESRRAALEVKTALVDSVLAEAKRCLTQAPADRYFATLLTLIEKNAQNGAGELRLGEKDLARLPDGFATRLPAGVTLSSVPAAIDDGFLLIYGDVEVNGTFDALFAAAGDELKLKAAQLLFSD